MRKMKRWLAIALCMMIVFLPVASEYYIIGHVSHACRGSECPICLEIESAVQVINTIRTLYLWSSVLLMFVGISAILLRSGTLTKRSRDTLITLKVELLD